MQQRAAAGGYRHGVFVEELKNRFLCRVRVDGTDAVCYVPSSCRLSNFLEMKDRDVLLSDIQSPKARTRYSLYAFKYRRRYIPVNLSSVNRVVEQMIHKRIFSYLGKRPEVLHEYSVEGYKSDLYIPGTKTIIEIKSILSIATKTTQFPTVYSERAIEQLKRLKALLTEGYRVCYLFVALNPEVQELQLNTDMIEFYQLFRECIELGMHCDAIAIAMKNEEPVYKRRLKLGLLSGVKK